MKLAIFSAFLLLAPCLTTHAFADEDLSPADSARYEQLNQKYAQSIEISSDEADDAKSQAVEGFDDNSQKSAPDTQYVLRKAMERLQGVSAAIADDDETPSSD